MDDETEVGVLLGRRFHGFSPSTSGSRSRSRSGTGSAALELSMSSGGGGGGESKGELRRHRWWWGDLEPHFKKVGGKLCSGDFTGAVAIISSREMKAEMRIVDVMHNREASLKAAAAAAGGEGRFALPLLVF